VARHLGTGRVAAWRRRSRGQERVGTPRSAARTRGETSRAKRVYRPRRYPRPDAQRLDHGEADAGVRGRRRRVCMRGPRRERARGPKARPLPRTHVCAKATRVAKATASESAGFGARGEAKGSTLPPKRRARVHRHADVREGARMRMPRSRPWR
jgi:hypothetical protein